MRAFVTGGTGFVGEALIRKLRARGDDVVALVRSPSRAARLEALGAALQEGDVVDDGSLKEGTAGCQACFHVAGVYRIGIPASEHPAMFEANVTGTERVIDAAMAAGVDRIVHVSTVNAFGNTRGKVVDETYRRDEADGFLSYYDETKYRAHQVALDRARNGAPVVIVQPGGVYGPGDHSEVGIMIGQLRDGKLRMLTFPELGFNFVYVDDVADGILLAHDRGRPGESYVLGGEITRLGDVLRKVAELTGRKLPRLTLPPALAKAAIPIGPLVGRLMGQPPNLRELISAAEGVTYWATDAKARNELGYSPRGLDQGLPPTLAA